MTINEMKALSCTLEKREKSTGNLFLFAIILLQRICLYYLPYNTGSDSISMGESYHREGLNSTKYIHCFSKTTVTFLWEIYLGRVSGDDSGTGFSDSCQEHPHLAAGGVLGLIQDNYTVVEASSPHVGQWCYFNGTVFLKPLYLLRIQQKVHGIIQRSEVWIKLLG